MTGVPVVLEGPAIAALVVGGGAVGTRRAATLLAAGARVRVVAPELSDELRRLAASAPRLALEQRDFAVGDVADANLVIAATDDRAANAAVARAARALHRLVNVADAPGEGDWVSAATHRAGAVTVGVTAGGVPGAARRMRDALSARFDDRYARAVDALAALRARLLADGDRDAWRRAQTELIGADFCALVESGALPERVRRWG